MNPQRGDDAIFRALLDTNRLHIAYRISLPDMWDAVERALGHPVTFTDEPVRP